MNHFYNFESCSMLQILDFVKNLASSNFILFHVAFLKWDFTIYSCHIRFPSFLRVTNVKDAANIIVRAVRRGDTLVFMPEYVYYFWLLIKYVPSLPKIFFEHIINAWFYCQLLQDITCTRVRLCCRFFWYRIGTAWRMKTLNLLNDMSSCASWKLALPLVAHCNFNFCVY